MLAEVNQLETLRQKIEDADYEAGNQSDYLDRGRPNPRQVKQAQELIDKLNKQSKALKAELKGLVAALHAGQPQAIDEWVNLHISILRKILDEKTAGEKATTCRFVAKTTLEEWAKVRTGEQEYVSVNWYYLKDYGTSVRKNAGKALWQFWK